MHRRSIDFIPYYNAGKFPEEVAREYGIERESIVNLNSNENPFAPPESVIGAIAGSAERAHRYPDPGYPRLKGAISRYVGLGEEDIAFGSGATEVLANLSTLFLDALDRVVVPLPAYTMHVFYSMLRDAELEFLQPGENFEVLARDVLKAAKKAKLIFLCSPNNPTGRAIGREEVLNIAEATGATVVVDEAYSEFHGRSLAQYVGDYKNLVVVRSFSKFFGLAGMRVGYAMASAETAALLEKLRQPFSISSVAEEAALKALEELEHFERLRKRIVELREEMFRELGGIEGMEPIPSDANFLLVRLHRVTSAELMDRLYARGIIVRDVSGLPGLDGDYLRITVGRREENEKLVSALREILD